MDELVIVIEDLNERAQDLTGTADVLRSEVSHTETGIDEAEARVRRLADGAGVTVRNESPVATPQREAQPKLTIGWSELAQTAEARLALRGLDLTEVTLDPLLTDEEIERIERRFSGTWRLKTQLDRYDVVSVVLAATVGAVIDIFFVKIPKTSRLLAERGALMHGGSPTTEWLQQHSVHHDNALSKWFKVPYDQVDLTATGEIIAGSGGKTHRFHTLGHDPLLGLLFGIVDIFYGSTTAIDRFGHFKYIPATGPPDHNPLSIIVKQLGHLLSDAFTRTGVPPPAWSALGAVQLGSIGEDQATVGQLARGMNVAGYDARHFLTQTLSVAATDLTLAGCWHLRHHLDAEWREQVRYEATMAGAKGTRDHPRFEAMALGAHMVTCAANAGKMALYGGSPLAVNYAAWMRFMHAGYRYARRFFISPTDLLTRQAAANAERLLDGWPEIDFSTPDAPYLDAHEAIGP